ncbi:MAG TPA: hypothetical protein VFW96_24680 [Thermomicrobiales bacterium]|nr:hypothetical protein [Thermomicrobiales bacterium]
MSSSRSSPAAARRSRPYGCLLGGLAGLLAVSLLWPAAALRADSLWILGALVGAGVGFLAQVTARRLDAGRRWRRRHGGPG